MYMPLACPLHMQVLYFSVTYNSLPRSFQHSVLDFSLSSNITFSSRPSLTTQAKATAISSLPYGTGLDHFLHIFVIVWACCVRGLTLHLQCTSITEEAVPGFFPCSPHPSLAQWLLEIVLSG